MAFKVPEKYRIKYGPYASDSTYGNNGLFIIVRVKNNYRVIASDQMGWEHVSVTTDRLTAPTWGQMCMIKSMFWDEEDVVVQYHPSKADYVNKHPGCLHLWRPVGIELPTPPTIMV